MVRLDFGLHGRFTLEGAVASSSPLALITFHGTDGSVTQVGIDLDKRMLLGEAPMSLDALEVEDIASKMNHERLRLISALASVA